MAMDRMQEQEEGLLDEHTKVCEVGMNFFFVRKLLLTSLVSFFCFVLGFEKRFGRSS